MVRVLLATVGTRGDCEPFFALVTELVQRKNVEAITLMATDEQCYLAPQSDKLKLVPLSFEGPPSITSRTWGQTLKRTFLPISVQIMEEASMLKPSIIIASTLIALLADIARVDTETPMMVVHLQPAISSNYYPNIYTHPKWAAESFRKLQNGKADSAIFGFNYKTHWIAQKFLLRQGLLEAINDIRLKQNLPERKFSDTMAIMSGFFKNTYVVQATDPKITPPAPRFSPNTHIVGPLAQSYIPLKWNANNLDPDLIKFINSGEKPVVVSYGSMYAGERPDDVTRALLSGLRDAEVNRVIIIPGRANLGLHQLTRADDEHLQEWAKERVFMTQGNVQYAWLLPKCEMMFCHCGAGTVYAAVRAGIPVLGTPVLADQPFYITVLKKMNLGVRVGKMGLPSITGKSVRKAIRRIRINGSLEQAKKFSKELSNSENGVFKVSNLIESICGSG